MSVSLLRCAKVSKGMRESERVASFTDHTGKKTHYIRVEEDFLTEKAKGEFWLPVGVVGVDANSKLVLIELPHEAETGTSRVWVKQDQLEQPAEAVA